MYNDYRNWKWKIIPLPEYIIVKVIWYEVNEMVQGILFKDERFETKDDNNLLDPITENIIIICNNLKLMDSFAEEIINTINGEAEYNDYWCDEEDVGKAKYELNFGLQKVININGQKITLGLEPALVYRAKQVEDIWFLDWYGKDKTYRELIYPLVAFKGSHEAWNEGLDRIYRNICHGIYGCYDGKWVYLKKDI